LGHIGLPRGVWWVKTLLYKGFGICFTTPSVPHQFEKRYRVHNAKKWTRSSIAVAIIVRTGFLREGARHARMAHQLGVLTHVALAIINLHPHHFTFTFVRNPFDKFVSMWKHSERWQIPYCDKKIENLTFICILKNKNKYLSEFDRYHSIK